MQARWAATATGLGLTVLVLLLAGCVETETPQVAPVAASAPDAIASSSFDSASTGTIRGRVLWSGPAPDVPSLLARRNIIFVPPWPADEGEKNVANPNAPAIAAEGGVGNAVVFLRQVDPRQARPWLHPPVTVAFTDSKLHIKQGHTDSQFGFVRRGSAADFVSEETRYHVVRGRGAAFFSLTLPVPQQSRSRQLHEVGVVEISSAAEYFWLRAYLFVAEHPYYARTDAHGAFVLEQVPAGDYELVAWMPNWHSAGHDRNPESMHISRLFFRSPVEQGCKVHVQAGQESTLDFTFATEMFRTEIGELRK